MCLLFCLHLLHVRFTYIFNKKSNFHYCWKLKIVQLSAQFDLQCANSCISIKLGKTKQNNSVFMQQGLQLSFASFGILCAILMIKLFVCLKTRKKNTLHQSLESKTLKRHATNLKLSTKNFSGSI